MLKRVFRTYALIPYLRLSSNKSKKPYIFAGLNKKCLSVAPML
jgi:hypothetical protein